MRYYTTMHNQYFFFLFLFLLASRDSCHLVVITELIQKCYQRNLYFLFFSYSRFYPRPFALFCSFKQEKKKRNKNYRNSCNFPRSRLHFNFFSLQFSKDSELLKMYSYDWPKQQSYLLTKPFEQHPIKQTQVTYNSSCTASSPPNTPPPVPSQSSMAIYIVSPTANIIYSSPTTIQTLGHSIIPGSSFLDYIHPDDLNE